MRLAKYTSYFLIGSVGLYLLLVLVFFAKEQEKRNLYGRQKLERLEGEYLVALNGYRMLADFAFDHLVNTSEVQAIMAAAHDRPQERDSQRQHLLTTLTTLYRQLAHLHFRQLHFHLSDSASFLRFHRPQKFGDSLVGIRQTVMAANAEKRRIQAFEEGRIFNGFRFVYPLFLEARHVGSVEISISSAALIAELSRLFGKQYHFLLDKSVVEQKVFADERSNYSRCLLSPQLLHDREVQAESLAQSSVIPEAIIRSLSIKVAQRFKEEIARRQPLVSLEQEEGMAYVVAMMPITNYKGDKVAYLISFEADTASVAHSGTFLWTLLSLTLLFAGALVFFLHIARTGRRLEEMSTTDFLTGIWNRGKGYELLHHEHERILRYGSRYSLIMFDVDHFKAVNDVHGHPAGDYVLKQVVKLVKDVSRRTDSVCRWGGEEFLLLLPETTLENALVLADKIRRAICEYDFKYVHQVTVSLGVTECRGNTLLVDEVISRVDQALYEAKQSGRNRVCHIAAIFPE